MKKPGESRNSAAEKAASDRLSARGASGSVTALSGLTAPKTREDTPYPSGSATVLSAQKVTASGRYIALPLHNNVRAAAGHGAVVGNEETDDSLMFREDWIYRDLRMQPKDLVLIRVSGESMRPTLNNGNAVDRKSVV